MGSLSFNTFSPLDPESFSEESKMVVDFIADYYKNVEKYPVQSQVDPGYLMHHCPDTAPYCPEPLETILKDVSDSIIPGLTHWQSPNFFGYFQANASTAGFLGEMLCTGLNVVGFNWIASPAATELESIVMDWVGKMLMLPPSFLFSGGGGGVLHGSTCEAIICSLAAARDKVLKKIGHHKITNQEIADGVSKSTQAVQAAEAGIRQIGTLARQQTASMIQERASLPIISLQPVVTGAAKKTSRAVGQATKTIINMISGKDFSSDDEDDDEVNRLES